MLDNSETTYHNQGERGIIEGALLIILNTNDSVFHYI